MQENLTEAEYMVMERMNKGKYLAQFGGTEAISDCGYFTGTIVKSGTIQRLLDRGLIVQSEHRSQRYLLTDEGRKLRIRE